MYCRGGHGRQLLSRRVERKSDGIDSLVDIVEHHEVEGVQIERYLASDELAA